MQKVIIIGATSGIGRALALRYLKAGHLVGITGRRTHLLDEIKHKYPQQTFTSAFDVTGNENTLHLQQLIDQLQGMDLFIYNSGYGEASKDLDWALDKKKQRSSTLMDLQKQLTMPSTIL